MWLIAKTHLIIATEIMQTLWIVYHITKQKWMYFQIIVYLKKCM